MAAATFADDSFGCFLGSIRLERRKERDCEGPWPAWEEEEVVVI